GTLRKGVNIFVGAFEFYLLFYFYSYKFRFYAQTVKENETYFRYSLVVQVLMF
ncbi:hypothetical protein X975_13593, partial [Stegodyphus mimosarum]